MLARERHRCFYSSNMAAPGHFEIAFHQDLLNDMAVIYHGQEIVVLDKPLRVGPIETVTTSITTTEMVDESDLLGLTSSVELREPLDQRRLSAQLHGLLALDGECTVESPLRLLTPLGLTIIRNTMMDDSISYVAPSFGGQRWTVNSVRHRPMESVNHAADKMDIESLLKQHLSVLTGLVRVIFDTQSVPIDQMGQLLLAMPGRVLEGLPPEVQADAFEQFFGIDDTVAELRKFVKIAKKDPELLAKHNVKRAQAVLLYGKSGTGKSELAEALGKALEAEIVYMSIGNTSGMAVAEWAQKLNKFFEDAYTKQEPVLIIANEMETLIRSGNSQVTDNLTGVLKNQFETMKLHPHVYFIGTTNNKGAIDPDVLVPKRIPLQLEIKPPATIEARKAVFYHFLALAATLLEPDPETDSIVQTLMQYDCTDFATKTDDYTVGDIQSIFEDVARRRLLNAEDDESMLTRLFTPSELSQGIERANKQRTE